MSTLACKHLLNFSIVDMLDSLYPFIIYVLFYRPNILYR